MIIGIDASRYSISQKTGTEWYSFEIINQLLKIFSKNTIEKVYLYSPSPLKGKIIDEYLKNENIINKVIPGKRLWTLLKLSFELKRNKPDVLFVPSHVLPLFRPKKSIITIHDCAFKRFKKAYSFFSYHYLNWSTKYACKNASKIIVPSNATKNDLIMFFKCPLNKIEVIYHGLPYVPDKFEVSTKKEEKFLKFFRLNKGDKYFLYIGRLESKKNIPRILEAFDKFIDEFPNYKFIFAGMRGQGFKQILKTGDKLKILNNIFMPGYVTKDEKWFLLKNCEAFIFPSLFEGFGFPPLEAFQFEKPVLTSNNSSLPEICADAALLVNPLKSEEILQGMKKLVQDVKYTNELVIKGKKQLKKFSWTEAGKKTYKVLLS